MAAALCELAPKVIILKNQQHTMTIMTIHFSCCLGGLFQGIHVAHVGNAGTSSNGRAEFCQSDMMAPQKMPFPPDAHLVCGRFFHDRVIEMRDLFLLILALELLFSLLGRGGVFPSGGTLRRLLGLGDVLDEEELEEELEEESENKLLMKPSDGHCWVSIF